MVILREVERHLDQLANDRALLQLEGALGLVTTSADISKRVGLVLVAVGHRIAEWEQMQTMDLLKDRACFDALFTFIDRADMYAMTHSSDGLGAIGDASIHWPDCWWGLLAARLTGEGLWRKLWDQIHRETQAIAAEPTIKEVRRTVASHAGKNAAQVSKAKAASWQARCINKAREMLRSGRPLHELPGILAPRFEKTERQVRTVLRRGGLLAARNKKTSHAARIAPHPRA